MDKVEEQYSYSFDLDAYKEEVKDSLKAQGFDNEFVFGLIDKATNKEGVDALVANIDLDELNKLNEEFGQLEKKAEELNNELEALINEVEGKEEVAQEDLDAILNKVNEIRENLDKMQKHINILPSEERENAQAGLDQVKELLNKAYKKTSTEIVDGLNNLSDEGKAVIKDEINQATTTEEIDKLVDEAKGISTDNDEFDASRLEGHKENATKVVDQFVEEALLSEEQAGNFKKAIENAEDLDAVDSVVEAVLKQVFENQKAAAVQDVENDINLSETLKEKYVPLLEGAETPEQLDEILLNLDKEEAKKAIDQLVENEELADHQGEASKSEVEAAKTTEEVEEALAGAHQKVFENVRRGAVDSVKNDKNLSNELKGKYVPLLEGATTGSELNEVLNTLDAEVAVEEAENKVKEADNFLKEAANDEEGITEQDLEQARQNNKEIEQLKAAAQEKLDKLSNSQQEVKTKLQDRLDKVNDIKLPPVSPSSKAELANRLIKESPLEEQRKNVYREKVKVDDSDNKIDDILAALAAEVEVKKAEDKEAVAESLVKEAVADDEVTDGERKAINDANEVVRNLKEDAQKSVNGLSDSVSDLREHLQGRLNNVDEAKIPGDDTKEAKEAVEKAEDKAKEADNFLKEAANDAEGITEQDLEKARQNNEEIEQLKAAAQEKLDKLSNSQQEVKTKLQDRLDKVNDIKLPPVSPSSKAELANRLIKESPLEEQRKNVYREKVKVDDSDNKIDDILAALAAEVEVKKAEDKEAVAESLVKEAVADDEVTDGERKAINDANEVVRNLKEDAQKSVNGLSDSVSDLREHLQGRLNNVDEAKIPGDDTKEAKEAVEKAEDKAKEADNFLKEAANDAEGITEQDLEKARTYNEDIAELKEKAQAEINKLPENVRKDLQERLNKVKSPGLPPVTPSSKAESANQTIGGASVLGEKRQQEYRDKVKEADKLANSEEKIDDILKALDAEIAVKRAEDKAKEAAKLVEQAKGREVTESEKAAIDSANKGVDYYKGEAEPKVTKLPDSVKDIKEDLKKRLDKVQKATLPSDGGNTASDQDGTGSTDAGTEQGTGDQTPGQGGGDSTEDSSTDEGTTPPTDGAGEGDTDSGQGTDDQAPDEDNGQAGTDPSDENDTPADEPSENPQLKAKKETTNKKLEKLSNLTEENKKKYKQEIKDATDEKTVDYILDKAELDDIKDLNAASKKDKDAEGRKEVTVEAQQAAKDTIKKINEKLKNNNLTSEQKEELKKLLGEIEVPRTHHYLPQIGNAVEEFLSTGILSGKAAHARVGWQANGQDNGNGTVWNKEVNFSSGDDILEVREGVGQNARINLGAGNDEFIIHGTIGGTIYAFRRTGGPTYVDGGAGKDKAIMKSKSKQVLQIQYIRNFNEVIMDGTDGELQITKENLEKSLGNEKVLKVRKGANGKNSTVKLNGMTSDDRGRSEIVTDKETGIRYRKWTYKGSDKEIWIEATRGLKTEL